MNSSSNSSTDLQRRQRQILRWRLGLLKQKAYPPRVKKVYLTATVVFLWAKPKLPRQYQLQLHSEIVTKLIIWLLRLAIALKLTLLSVLVEGFMLFHHAAKPSLVKGSCFISWIPSDYQALVVETQRRLQRQKKHPLVIYILIYGQVIQLRFANFKLQIEGVFQRDRI